MSRGRETHRARREELVAQSAAQREEIARVLGAWSGALAGADRAFRVLGHVRKITPLLGVVLGVATLIASRSRNASGLIRGAVAAWRSTRSVLGFVAGLR